MKDKFEGVSSSGHSAVLASLQKILEDYTRVENSNQKPHDRHARLIIAKKQIQRALSFFELEQQHPGIAETYPDDMQWDVDQMKECALCRLEGEAMEFANGGHIAPRGAFSGDNIRELARRAVACSLSRSWEEFRESVVTTGVRIYRDEAFPDAEQARRLDSLMPVEATPEAGPESHSEQGSSLG
jgi:hypothetical protein